MVLEYLPVNSIHQALGYTHRVYLLGVYSSENCATACVQRTEKNLCLCPVGPRLADRQAPVLTCHLTIPVLQSHPPSSLHNKFRSYSVLPTSSIDKPVLRVKWHVHVVFMCLTHLCDKNVLLFLQCSITFLTGELMYFCVLSQSQAIWVKGEG